MPALVYLLEGPTVSCGEGGMAHRRVLAALADAR
jgi:hypothetical protein